MPWRPSTVSSRAAAKRGKCEAAAGLLVANLSGRANGASHATTPTITLLAVVFRMAEVDGKAAERVDALFPLILRA
jgi:uncharacterized tellurite resistance protein B-like protein